MKEASPKNLVSVIIPSIRDEMIPDLEQALKDQSHKIIEIIVVYDKERKGPSWARNQGIQRASGEWLAFIDDDCIPQSDWIELLLLASDEFNADVVGGSYDETDPLLKDLRRKKYYPKKAQIDNFGYVAAGGNIMFSKEILIQIKSKDGYVYNESMKIGEDHELCWRLHKQDAIFVFVPIFHRHLKRLSGLEYLKLKFFRGKGIYSLNESIKRDDLKPFQKSLVWSGKEKNKFFQLIKIGIKLIIGPFDIKNFSSVKNFILYWAGEKIKVIGFLTAKLFSD